MLMKIIHTLLATGVNTFIFGLNVFCVFFDMVSAFVRCYVYKGDFWFDFYV